MAIAAVGTLGTGASSTSTSSFTLTTATNTLAAGDFGLLSIVADNTSTADGVTNDNTLVSGGTGTWTKLGEYTNAPTAAAAVGVTTSLWIFAPTATLAIGSTITITYGTARVDKCATFFKFTKTVGASIALTSGTTNPITNEVTAANGFGSVAFSGLSSANRLYFRALGKEANSTTALTVSTSFNQVTNTRSRNNASAVSLWAEYRINTSTGETSNPTLAVSGDSAGVFVSLQEVVSYTLTGEKGTFLHTGQSANTLRSRAVAGEKGTFVHTGKDASLSKVITLTGATGAFVHSGKDASLLRSLKLSGETGSFVHTGKNANLSVESLSTTFITGTPSEPLRNNFTGVVGCKITIGSSPLTITHVGRWVVSGNTGTHRVYIASNLGVIITDTLVDVDTLGAPASAFKYVALLNPVVLSSGVEYFLVSEELSSGDQWHEESVIIHSSDATINFSAYGDYGGALTTGASGRSYVPPNFKYTVSVGNSLSANTGTFSLSGQNANLNRGLLLSGDTGTFTHTGKNATLEAPTDDPFPMTGIQFWFKADSLALSDYDPVVTWEDSSVAGNDVTQSNPAARPLYRTNTLNSLPTLDLTSAKFLFSSGITHGIGTGDFFVSAVIKAPPTEDSYRGFWGNGTYSPGFYIRFGKLHSYFEADLAFSTVLTPDDWYVVTIGRESGVMKGWVNGVLEAATHSNTSTVPDTLFMVGLDGGGDYFNSSIAEIVFAASSPTAQRSSTETYMMTKYALGSSLGSTTLTASVGSFSLDGKSSSLLVQKKLSADVGTFSETGIAANLQVSKALSCNKGTYLLTGNAAGLSRGLVTSGTKGTFALTGVNAGLLVNKRLTSSVGAFALSGKNSAYLLSKKLSVSAGAFVSTGVAASLKTAKKLSANTGTFTESGISATLKTAKVLSSSTGSFALSGKAASLLRFRSLLSSVGTFNLTGKSASLVRSLRLNSSVGSFAVTGISSSAIFGKRLSAVSGAFVLTGQSALSIGGYSGVSNPGSFSLVGGTATFTIARKLSSSTGSFVITGVNSSALLSRKLSAASGSFSLTGQSSSPIRGYSVDSDTGSVVVVGNSATFRISRNLSSSAGTFSLNGKAATLIVNKKLVAESGLTVLAGKSASLLSAYRLSASKGTFVQTGNAANISVSRLLTGSSASFSLSGKASSSIRQYRLSASAGSFALTGFQATTLGSTVMTSLKGSFSTSGQSANLLVSRKVSASAATFVSTGKDASLTRAQLLIAGSGAVMLNASEALLKKNFILDGRPATISFIGIDSDYTRSILAGLPTVTISPVDGTASGQAIVIGLIPQVTVTPIEGSAEEEAEASGVFTVTLETEDSVIILSDDSYTISEDGDSITLNVPSDILDSQTDDSAFLILSGDSTNIVSLPIINISGVLGQGFDGTAVIATGSLPTITISGIKALVRAGRKKNTITVDGNSFTSTEETQRIEVSTDRSGVIIDPDTQRLEITDSDQNKIIN